MRFGKMWLWIGWLGATTVMGSYLAYCWRGDDRTLFLPGATTHGHYQIELSCNACHTPWMGVQENACLNCHAAELEAADDSHPKSKFSDPRNADRLDIIRADNCVTCHREHQPELTQAMGVTMPMDYCFHCHQQTLEDRPSHASFGFDSCATTGCHNYHDNTALYTEFLLKHADEPDLKEPAVRPALNPGPAPLNGEFEPRNLALKAGDLDAPEFVQFDEGLTRDWAVTAHARAGINCTGCHAPKGEGLDESSWSDQVDHTTCASCHESEAEGFLEGRHGMRLAQGLSPMRPGLARLPMKSEAAHRELTCVSCHGAHKFDLRRASVESCLECHDDAHSLAYVDSPHFDRWRAELAGRASPGEGVSCATCHLPRETIGTGGDARVVAQHNQNNNLRPNEKMIRSVCLDCHGLAFSIDALADPDLARKNFAGRPGSHVESVDLALRWQAEARKQKAKNQ